MLLVSVGYHCRHRWDVVGLILLLVSIGYCWCRWWDSVVVGWDSIGVIGGIVLSSLVG